MNLRTARVQGKPRLHGKTLPTKQNTPQTKTRSRGLKEHQDGRELCHAVAMEMEDTGSEFFLGQGSGVRYLVLFGTRSWVIAERVMYFTFSWPPRLGFKAVVNPCPVPTWDKSFALVWVLKY